MNLEIIKRNTAEIIPEEELFKRLRSGKKLRVKLGIDPTAPEIHLGFAVVLRKLYEFQEIGHQAILIVGDFTAKIGDPSGISKTRPQLTDLEIKKNMKEYKSQILKILQPNQLEFRYNSEWLSKLTPEFLIKLASKSTVAQMIEREDFTKRYSKKEPISLHELLYALFQAYDSVATNADIEIGGTDQKFNLLLGRQLQREFGQQPQVIITMPLLEGLDGTKKMSKSYNNYIGIAEHPNEMFGKLMSIPDTSIINYFKLTTNLSDNEIKHIEKNLKEQTVNPRDLKLRLAEEVVSMYHSHNEALKAKDEFLKIFSKKELPTKIPTYTPMMKNIRLVSLLVDSRLAPSRSEARRLIEQGGVKLNGVAIRDINFEFNKRGIYTIKVGKRKFLKIKIKNKKILDKS